MDFNLNIYEQLIRSLKHSGYSFLTFLEALAKENLPDENIEKPFTSSHLHTFTSSQKTVILRHDVDLLPQNSLRFAQIQAEMGIKGSYYFRAVPESWDESIIKEIASLGHEVGYHYENMDVAFGKLKDQRLKAKVKKGSLEYDNLIDAAYEDFIENLEKLRKLVPVSTICMHGSPKSKFDNKAIWDNYEYKDLGLIGEPYYDVDFDEMFYLTDTGRRWDGWKVSVRDKVPQQQQWNKQGLTFHSTMDIIDAITGVKNEKRKVKSENKSETLNSSTSSLHRLEPETLNFPSQIMFTFHPQRWHASFLPWTKELLMQKAKNVVKRWLFVK